MYKDKIFKTQVPEFKGGKWKSRQLFYNGIRQIRARWPKNDFSNPLYTGWAFVESKSYENSRSSFIYKDDKFFNKISKPSEGEVNLFVGDGWWNSIFPIKSIDNKEHLITLCREIPQFDNGPIYYDVWIDKGQRYFIENVLEGLTRPGEWYFDSEEGSIYFWPPDDKIHEGKVVIPVLNCLIDIFNTSCVEISGFTFTETLDGGDYQQRFGLEGFGSYSIFGNAKYCGEALHLKGAKYCCIKKNNFDSVGGNAIYIEKDSFRNTISHNEISSSGASGICISGNRERHPRFDVVENNHIHNTGSILKYTAGINLGMSDGILVRHNYIHHVPLHAINLGTNGLGRNYIEYNKICYASMECKDTAAINAWGDVPGNNVEGHTIERSGHFIRNNYIVDTVGFEIDKKGNISDNNKFSFGIYLDDFASNCYVSSNIVIRAGKGVVVHNGRHNVVENNIFVDCIDNIWCQNCASRRLGNQFLTHFMVNNIFRNNIFYFSNPNATILYFLFWSEDHKEEVYSAVGYMDNNIYYHAKGGAYNIKLRFRKLGSKDGFLEDDTHLNILSSFQDWMKKSGLDKSSIFADPMFISVEDDNYQLKSNSPAFKLGFQKIDLEKIGIIK